MIEAGPWAAAAVVEQTVCEERQGIVPWLLVLVPGLGMLELLLTWAAGGGRLLHFDPTKLLA